MKNLIEQKIKDLKQLRAQLDGEIKRANEFLQHAVPEITGLHRAITEMEQLLKDAEEPKAEKEDVPG